MQPSLTQTKICGSCKRNLYIGSFGVFRKSKDGLNSTCLECRNFKRRCNYHKSATREPLIFPLSNHNESIINLVNSESSPVLFKAHCLSTNTYVDLELTMSINCWTIKVTDSQSIDESWFLSGSRSEQMLKLLNVVLVQRRIRLVSKI